MKKISIITPCYNEEENIEDIYAQVKDVFCSLQNCRYEHIFIDNASEDKTVSLLKRIAEEDKNVKIIVNIKNFGHILSPHHALFQATGDAMIFIVADLQDPPEMIQKFIKKWEEGYKIVVGVKSKSREAPVMFFMRKVYYELLDKISDTKLIKNFTGFGLYDREVIDIVKKINEPYPYFRGLICDLGFDIFQIEYVQPKRERGITKNNFFTLFDMAILGITKHSKVPLRIITIFSFFGSFLSFLTAIVCLVYKLVSPAIPLPDMNPLITVIFFLIAFQLLFTGIIAQYTGTIQRQIKKTPVIEKERINFE